ncbi:MAG TPA: HipA family kinase, partial [Chitinophagaceae bacterium]|jgi:hypothetical protein
LDFNVPEPVVVNVNSEFVDLLVGNDMHQVAGNSLGFNFGNEYQRGYYPLLKDQPVTDIVKQKLLDLFAFDMLISNSDRRIDKPNFLFNGNDVLVFDHEIAFGFLFELPFLRNNNPWLFRDSDMDWINLNFCFNLLKGNEYNFLPFLDKLISINDLFWDKIETIIPQEWFNSQFGTIKNNLSSMVEHADLFTGELTRLLQ